MNKTKGFGLIELLALITIIGILASVVIASIQEARTSNKKENETYEEFCLRRGTRKTITELPATCTKYFNNNKTY